MKQKQVLRIRTALIIIAVLSMANALHSQAGRLAPLSKIKVMGEVTMIKGDSGAWVISPWFSVTRDGTPVSKLNVSVEGFRLRETMPGQYAGIRITTLTPATGNTLHFSIASRFIPSSTPVLTEKIAISGSAVIGSLAAITQPIAGSSLNAAALGTALVVAWTGGVPPFALGLLKPSGGAFLEIFSQKGLPEYSFSLPATLFLPGITYHIVVSYNMEPFVLKTNVLKPADHVMPFLFDKSSAVSLRCSVISNISII